MRMILAAAFCMALTFSCGCGDGKSTVATGPSASDDANDLAEMLKEYFELRKKAPNSLADLSDGAATHPVGHSAVQNESYVVYWRVPLSTTDASTVLAYPKDAATKGGLIVMLNGTVKAMTAEEFKAAPKAGKK